MLLALKTALWYDGMINSLLITTPVFLSNNTKVICEGIDDFHIMSYQEAITQKYKIVARLWFSFESKKPLLSHDGCDELYYKHYHNTIPLFQKISYNRDRMHIGPTFTRFGKAKNILETFIKYQDLLTLSKRNR